MARARPDQPPPAQLPVPADDGPPPTRPGRPPDTAGDRAEDPGDDRRPAWRLADSHAHAWRRWPYPPLVPDEETRGRVEQLVYEMDTHGVEAVLLVCAEIDENPDNNAYGASAAARYPERVFPVVDVDSFWSPTHHRRGAADRLRRAVERFRPVGVTHYCGPHNDGWLRSEEADAFFAAATEHRLILSLAVGPAWQRDLRALAVRHPALPIVCHHLGAPDLLAAPGGGLAEVVASAVAPNVAIKASGFHYVSARGWDHPWPDALAVLRVLAESFGPRRLFWGSDFPASRRYTTYRQSLEAVRSHADFLDDDARRAVLGENLLRLLQTREPAG